MQLQNLNKTIKTQLTQHKNEQWENILKKATTKDNSLWKNCQIPHEKEK
jgi:hypothetical protein